jgi:2-polyprenyl-3-methyl-5-hydroxy-6-metoxy-1,4-benzoquinol methylase
MLQRYGSVRAIEMHAPAVEYCQRRYPDIQVEEGVIPDPLDRRFDIICLFDVLEHILDDRMALDWIDEHLAPGGMLFLTVPAHPFLWSRHDEVAHHHRRYTMGTLLPLVTQRFDLRYATHFNTHLFPAIAAVRLLQRLLRLSGGEADKAAGGGPLNAVLKGIFAAERLWLPPVRLPFGVSIFTAATKKARS